MGTAENHAGQVDFRWKRKQLQTVGSEIPRAHEVIKTKGYYPAVRRRG